MRKVRRHLWCFKGSANEFHMATSTEGKADTSAACHCVFTDDERTIMNDLWTDQFGYAHKVPATKFPLKCCKHKGHAALRSFVIYRDGGCCIRCKSTSDLVADHIVSLRNGGNHHPSNLQCLCRACNSKKGMTEDMTLHGNGRPVPWSRFKKVAL